MNEQVGDMFEQFVWEPEAVRINVLMAATEAACTGLSVDQTVKNPKTEEANQAAKAMRENQAKPRMGRGMKRM